MHRLTRTMATVRGDLEQRDRSTDVVGMVMDCWKALLPQVMYIYSSLWL